MTNYRRAFARSLAGWPRRRVSTHLLIGALLLVLGVTAWGGLQLLRQDAGDLAVPAPSTAVSAAAQPVRRTVLPVRQTVPPRAVRQTVPSRAVRSTPTTSGPVRTIHPGPSTHSRRGPAPASGKVDGPARKRHPSRTPRPTVGPSVAPSSTPTPTPTPTPSTTSPSSPPPRPTPAPTTTAPKPSDPTSTEEPTPTPSPTQPTPTPTPTAKPTPTPTQAPAGDAAMVAEVVRLTNVARSAAGCGAVHVDDRLAEAARLHSQDMADQAYFSHTSLDGRSPWDRMRAQGYTDGSGENIAAGQGSAASVMESWMNSDGHRANIENCESVAVGVGIGHGGSYGIYWTQAFGRS